MCRLLLLVPLLATAAAACTDHSGCSAGSEAAFCNAERECSPCFEGNGQVCDVDAPSKYSFDRPIDGDCETPCINKNDNNNANNNDNNNNNGPSTNNGKIAVANPSFETAGDWYGLSTRGSSELFAAPDGTSFAEMTAGSKISQNLGVMEANTVYSAVVWTRSVNAHVPKASGESKGVQVTHKNLLAKAKITVKSSGGSAADVASAQVVVSPNTTVVSNAANEHDDGANIFIVGDYRMHVGNALLSQPITSDPASSDPWTQLEFEGEWGMAVGPVTDLDGNLVIQALGGGVTRTDLTEKQLASGMQVSSRIELTALYGEAPNFSGPNAVAWDMNDAPIFNTVLSHLGDEAPWVFDPHYCYDKEADKLWMTWGGHSMFITEVDTVTGKVVDPATGREPATGTEFNTHAQGVHTKILTNEPWTGLKAYDSKSEAPAGWEGDAFSSQSYMEGMALMKHGKYFYACGTYGSMGDSYTIRCCRQDASEPTAPRGPYTDKDGSICSEFDTNTNRYPASMLLGPDGDHLVPGHPHFWRETKVGKDGVEEEEQLYLGYDFRDQIPSVREDAMAVRRLFFDANDWPTIWTPIGVTVDTAASPELVGQQLTLELAADGAQGSKVAFDQVSVTTTTSGGGGGKPSPPVKVACIGDSITEAPTHVTYPTVLQQLLEASSNSKGSNQQYEVVNLGESGATASPNSNLPYWAGKAGATDANGNGALVTAFDPDVAIIMLGTNDCDGDESANVASTYQSGLEAIILALPTSARKILATPPPALNSEYTDNGCLRTVVEPAIAALAAKYGGLTVVQVRATTTAAEYAKWYAEDGVHPNNEGLAAIAKKMHAAVLGEGGGGGGGGGCSSVGCGVAKRGRRKLK